MAIEMEWNNKDPFYHRDLNNFAGLHNECVIEETGYSMARVRGLLNKAGTSLRGRGRPPQSEELGLLGS